ncbi:putative membrane protein [Alteromonadaceae bacterium 2753L.S.0a.02]|nr:putative membrane protein [Alteromonadaceae bacterium 2753L.S.0a.02]
MIKRLYRWIRGLFLFVWLLGVLIIGVWIAWANQDYISVNLFAIELPRFPVGGYLSITFASGVLLGWFGTWILARIKLYSRKRELSKVKKEVNKLRTAQLDS